jgi:hypothetical protein
LYFAEICLQFPHLTIFSFVHFGHGNLVDLFMILISDLHEVQINFTMLTSRNKGFIMVLIRFKKVLYPAVFLKHMKQVILVRKDLKLTKGKLAAQAAHASLCSALKVKKMNPELFD